MSKKLMVYIAGPYTNPEPVENTRKAIDAWKVLVDAGYLPFVPHLTLLVQFVYPHDPDFWYALDIDFLEHCDVLLRLPGESVGADREVEKAKELGLIVFEGSAEEFVVMFGKESQRKTFDPFDYDPSCWQGHSACRVCRRIWCWDRVTTWWRHDTMIACLRLKERR